jgi:hypothetical protein
MSLPLYGLLFSGFALTRSAEACCAVAGRGESAVNADQEIILVWDKEQQTEHFIRKASFRSEGDSVGFLVPTPSRPQLEQSGNAAFSYLRGITAPKEPPAFLMPLSCSSSPSAAMGSVRVIEEKTVAGYRTVVLAADSGKALVAWLREHDYAYTPETAEWAQPYLEKKWYMTAMKIAKTDGATDPIVAASALRISFKTDQPLFPYREPDSRQAAEKLHVSDRLLRIFFIAESRYEGRFPSGQAWGGLARWSHPLSGGERSRVLGHLALPESTGPSKFWLTEFSEHWAYGKAPGDVYFRPSADQQTLARAAAPAPITFDLTLATLLGFIVARPLIRRRSDR